MGIRVAIPPRMLTRPQAGAYMGRSGQWLADHEAELRAEGFPAPHPVLGLYDRKAIDDWLDATGGRKVYASAEAEEWN